MIACALADTPGAKVHLVESNAKKAAFLREAVRITGAAAVVCPERVADFIAHAPEPDRCRDGAGTGAAAGIVVVLHIRC